MALPIFTWRGAILQSELPSTTRHVLLTLSCYMNEVGDNCFPSIETICNGTGLSNRAVLTHLKIATELGWITVEKHGYGGRKWARNQYYLTYPDEYVQVVSKKCSEPDDIKAVNVVPEYEKAVNVVPEGSEPDDIKAVNDVHTNSSKNFSMNSPPPSGDDPTGKQVSKIGWDVPDKMFKGITPERMEAWQRAFPGFDVEGELTRIDLWYERRLRESPKFRWKNAERGIHNWLSRAYTDLRKPKVFVKQQAPATQPTR